MRGVRGGVGPHAGALRALATKSTAWGDGVQEGLVALGFGGMLCGFYVYNQRQEKEKVRTALEHAKGGGGDGGDGGGDPKTAAGMYNIPSDPPVTKSCARIHHTAPCLASPPFSIMPHRVPLTHHRHLLPPDVRMTAESEAVPEQVTLPPRAPMKLKVPYVLVGSGTASHFAMRAIIEADPDAKILLIGEEPQMYAAVASQPPHSI
jgi:hypothetical protein